MITTRYPDDPSGKKPENTFHEEWIIDSNDNSNRIVRLNHAPFFGTLDITVGDGTYTLVEGKDFEYVFELTGMRESVDSPVFMGIQLVNREINGRFQITGQHLGADWYDPLIDILDYLIKIINNPKDGDWLNLSGVPSLFPAQLGYTGWSDFQNKQYVASAIDDVSGAMAAKADDRAELIDDIADEAKALLAKIVAFDYPGHIAALNPHTITPLQLDAHPLNLEVPDAILAFGMNLRELTEFVRSRGVKESELDIFLQKWVSGSTTGTSFKTSGADTIVVKTADGSATLKVDNSKVEMRTGGSVVFTAGYDLNGSRYHEYVCGVNTLRITSGADKLTTGSLTLNGVEILTSRTITRFQQNDAGQDGEELQIAIQSSNINFTGQGTTDSPLKGTLDIPVATTAKAGGVKLLGRKGDETDGFAASPASVSEYEGEFGDYVPKTTQINNKPMSGTGITITKADFSLASADNTADANKPLSTPQKERTDALVNKVHTHDWSQLMIGSATAQDYGTVVLADTLDKAKLGDGVMPKVLKGLSDRLEAVRPRLVGGMAKDALDFTAIAESTFNIQNNWTLSAPAPVEFFLSKSLDASQGSVLGSVDLTTIENNEWYRGDCAPETGWAKGIETNEQSFDDSPEYLHGTFVEEWADRTGFPAGTRACKFRFKSSGGAIKISLGSITPISQVYVDGESLALGGNSIDITPELEAGVHTIGFVYPIDATLGAAVVFEVFEGDEIIMFSRPGLGNFSVLGQYATYKNTRFFIYADVQTGLYYARATPIMSDSVDMQNIFVGFVDTSTTGIIPTSGTTVVFEKSVDYGMFRELKEHLEDPNAHPQGDVNVSVVEGLENTKPYGVVDTNFLKPMRFAIGSATPADVPLFSYGSNGSGVWADNINGTLANPRIVIEPNGQSPLHWETIKNPDELGVVNGVSIPVDTIDGCIMFQSDSEPSLEWWAPAVNGKYDAIRTTGWSSSDKVTLRKITDRGDVSFNAFSQLFTPDGTDVAVLTQDPETTWVPSITYPEHIDGVNINRPNIYIIRYRYIPELKTLRLVVEYSIDGGWKTPTVEGRLFTFQFSEDMSRFFRGRMLLGANKTVNFRVLGSLFSTGTPVSVLKKVNRYRSLTNLYLTVSQLQAYGIERGGLVAFKTDSLFKESIVGMASGRGLSLNRYTQDLQISKESGVIADTMTEVIPYQMLNTAHWAQHGKKPVPQLHWQPATTYAAIAPDTSYLSSGKMTYQFLANLPFNPTGVSVKGIANCGMTVYVDRKLVLTKPADQLEGTRTDTLPDGQTRGYIELVTEASADGQNAYVGASITFTGAQGESKTVSTSDLGWKCIDSNDGVRIQMLVPWHFTQRNWEHVVDNIKNEKE